MYWNGHEAEREASWVNMRNTGDEMKHRLIPGALLAGLLSAGAVLAEPVAMVTEASGGVSAVSGGKSKKIPLLAYLEPGTIIQLDANARLSITLFAKPVEYRFTGPAKLTVEEGRIAAVEGKTETQPVSLEKTSAAKKFTAAQRESVAQAAYEMRAGRPGLRLDDPVDTRLTGDDLVFTWDGPRPANGYQLSLYDSRRQLLCRESSSASSWTPPAGLLKAGGTYEWEIRAPLESGEVLTARGSFSVASSADARIVRTQRPPAGATFSERVLYAVFLEEKGFKYEARRIWRELARERPDDAVAKEHSIR